MGRPCVTMCLRLDALFGMQRSQNTRFAFPACLKLRNAWEEMAFAVGRPSLSGSVQGTPALLHLLLPCS